MNKFLWESFVLRSLFLQLAIGLEDVILSVEYNTFLNLIVEVGCDNGKVTFTAKARPKVEVAKLL